MEPGSEGSVVEVGEESRRGDQKEDHDRDAVEEQLLVELHEVEVDHQHDAENDVRDVDDLVGSPSGEDKAEVLDRLVRSESFAFHAQREL